MTRPPASRPKPKTLIAQIEATSGPERVMHLRRAQEWGPHAELNTFVSNVCSSQTHLATYSLPEQVELLRLGITAEDPKYLQACIRQCGVDKHFGRKAVRVERHNGTLVTHVRMDQMTPRERTLVAVNQGQFNIPVGTLLYHYFLRSRPNTFESVHAAKAVLAYLADHASRHSAQPLERVRFERTAKALIHYEPFAHPPDESEIIQSWTQKRRHQHELARFSRQLLDAYQTQRATSRDN